MLPSQVDNSQISRSTSEAVNTGFRRKLALGQVSKLDFVFPLMDNICQHTSLSSLISTLVVLFFYCQLLLTSLWPVTVYWENEGIEAADEMSYVRTVFWFTKRQADTQYLMIGTIVVCLICAICYGWLIFVLANYKRTHRFEKWGLYPARWAIEIISPIMFHPSAALAGAAIVRLSIGDSLVNWAFVVLDLVAMIGFMVLFLAGFSMNCNSAFLNVTYYSMYEPGGLIILAVASAVLLVLTYILTRFSDWVTVIVQLVHTAFCVIVMTMFWRFPFHKLSSSVVGCAVCATCILQNITMIIFNFLRGVPVYVVFILLAVYLVGSFVVFYPVLLKRARKIVSDMMYPEEGMSEEDKVQHFMSLGLGNNEAKALMYLRMGFATIGDFFIDWSFMKFVAQTYPSNNAICRCIQILAFFPGESRQLNAYFFNATAKRNLSFAQRFLIYQVYRIKTLRQSSASSDANEKLAELKRLSSQCESDINSFWLATEASVGYFEMIATEVRSTDALWQEAIRDYPNNSKFSDEYCRFLTECSTDFDAAMVQKHRSELIEIGTNFSIDLSFRSLVRCYPDYLKKSVLDLKGNVILKRGKKDGGSSANDKSSGSATAQLEIDAEMENTLGKSLFRHAKLRVALHHSIKERQLGAVSGVPIAAILTVIVTIGAFVGLLVYYKLTYDERGTSMNRLNYITKTRFYFALTNIVLLQSHIISEDKMGNMETLEAMANEDEGKFAPYFKLNEAYDETVMDFAVRARDYLGSVLDEIAALAGKDVNVYNIAEEMLRSVVGCPVCSGIDPVDPFMTNLKNIFVLDFFHQESLAGSEKSQLFNSSHFCEIIATWPYIRTATDTLFLGFAQNQRDVGKNLNNTELYLTIGITVAVLLLTAVPTLILLVSFVRGVTNYANTLFQLDKETKAEAQRPLRRDAEDEVVEAAEPKKVRSIGIVFVFISFLLALIISLLVLAVCLLARNTNNTISNLNSWEYYAAQRITLTAEILHSTMLAILMDGDVPTTYTNQSYEVRKCSDDLVTLKLMNERLLQGTDTLAPCFHVDDLLDQYNIDEACNEPDGPIPVHNVFKCASANQGISIFSNMITEILLDIDSFGGTFMDLSTSTVIHLANTHLWNRLDLSLNRIVELGTIEYDNLISTIVIILIVGIIVSFIDFAFLMYVRSAMILTFDACKGLIKRLPPHQIVNNKRLLNLLLNRETMKRDEEVSVNSSIVKSNLDGIMCTGISGVVEIVNPAVSTVLGYTPEQLLGQPFTAFFTDKESEKVDKQLTLMRNGQSATTYEDHTVCVTDSGTEVQCHLTILGMSSSHTTVDSFVIILRDETELIAHQKEAEDAKQKSENLLFQILPRTIVTRINQGEKDISFTVPSATIIFIDIVKFSDYAALLTPEEIMGNLSTVFAAFDRLCEKYPLILKIKLIGDVYMAAAGLFSPEEQPQSHAEQVIKFGLDVLQELDEINVKLNANLAVRIGVNSGGPLIAGVLGTDKPVFDIIGDPINVAARLQSTDIAGRIQIPQSTYDLISGMNFDIEERGEVFLKGKGKTLAYFVKPQNIFMAQLSSSSEFKLTTSFGMDPSRPEAPKPV